MKTTIISLGGSLIVPEDIDVKFLKEFKAIIDKFTSDGNRAVIICGGGRVNNRYNKAARDVAEISDKDLDWIGIYCTRVNAQLVRSVFGDQAYEQIVENPTEKIKTDRKIIIGCGWKPGHSSDMDAVLIAKNLGAERVINLTNIDYVYDKDPKKNKDAKALKELAWKDYLDIVGREWKPRMNSPFDPIASQEAEKSKLKVMIVNGNDLSNFEKCLHGGEFKGSLIG